MCVCQGACTHMVWSLTVPLKVGDLECSWVLPDRTVTVAYHQLTRQSDKVSDGCSELS